MKYKLLGLSLLFIIALTGCNGNDEEENVIYTTVYPVGYLVEEIAGDTVVVKRVPGSQTHSESIDWTPKEIIDMIESDIIFYIDAGVDSYIPNNKNTTFEESDAKLVNISELIEYNKICATHDHSHEEEDHEEDHEETALLDEGVAETCEVDKIMDDPHFWLDPVRMLEVATQVKDLLVIEYPENEEQYNTSYGELKVKLETLHDKYELMANEATKPIITTSLLFSYFEARYGIEIIALATTPHTGENIPSDIIEITEEAVFHDIHYVLYESNVNSPAADALFEEIGKNEGYEINKGYLHGLGTLITEEIEQGETYLTIMYNNLEVLKDATK